MSINFILLLVVFAVVGGPLALGATSAGWVVFLFVVAGWVVSLCLHEFGHAWLAWRAGDTTMQSKGYLTLDPVRYADPLTSLILPVAILAMGGIGFPGGAVYIRQDLVAGRVNRSLVSLAGPAMTAVAMLAYAVPLAAAPDSLAPAFRDALALLVLLQATALLLNLLPIPGLDGFGAIEPFLPQAVLRALAPIRGFIFLGLFAVLILLPGVTRPLFAAAFAILSALGVHVDWVIDGFEAFRFWR
jgi:Zn-dependent protease